MREAKPLLSHANMDVTLLRVTTRRFVNKLRIIVAVRFTNRMSFPLNSSWMTLRLGVGDDVVAPVKYADVAVNGGTNTNGEFVFEVPPMTTTAMLRAIAEGLVHGSAAGPADGRRVVSYAWTVTWVPFAPAGTGDGPPESPCSRPTSAT